MTLMRQLVASRHRFFADQQAAILDLVAVAGNVVRFEARLASTSEAMEFPVVPRADHVIADDVALAQWASNVIAYPGDDADLPAAARDSDGGLAQNCFRDFAVRKGFKLPNVDPLLRHKKSF
jgi:hypothetical protein